MSKRTTESMGKSSPGWDELEDWLRGSMQNLIQHARRGGDGVFRQGEVSAPI